MSHLTDAQIVTLRAAIFAIPAGAAYFVSPGNVPGLQTWLNGNDAGVIAWKSSVSVTEVGDNIVGSELSGLTSLNISRLQAIVALSQSGLNPSLADRRAFFDDVFSGTGGAGTRAKLLALWKRPMKRWERAFATGTGSDAVPAILAEEGIVDVNDCGRLVYKDNGTLWTVGG